MLKTKGTDVVALKRLLARDGGKAAAEVERRLTPELGDVFHRIVATSWTPVEQQMAIYLAAAAVLFPDEGEPMEALGYTLAESAFRGAYKIFLRIPSIEFIMTRAAKVWRSYYEKGDAGIENVTNTGLDFVVRNLPELPPPMRTMAKGHIRFLTEAAGMKNVRVTLHDSDPWVFRWTIRWHVHQETR